MEDNIREAQNCLIDIQCKINVLSCIDPELFSVPEDEFIKKARLLLHGILLISKSLSDDIYNVIEKLD